MRYSLFLVYDYECEFRYLGATTNYKKLKKGKYRGSGLLWQEHLKECNHSHSTIILLHTTDSHEEHTEKAKYYSKEYNIVENYWFLNLQEEHGVPEILENPELVEFRKKIGYYQYDKFVKDQMNPDIEMMHYTKEEQIAEGYIIRDKFIPEKERYADHYSPRNDIYNKHDIVPLDSIKNHSYSEEDKVEKEILWKSIIENLLPKTIKPPTSVNKPRLEIYEQMKKLYPSLDIHAYEIYTMQCLYESRFVLDQTFSEIAENHPYNIFISDTHKDPGKKLNEMVHKHTEELKKYLITKEDPLAEKNIS